MWGLHFFLFLIGRGGDGIRMMGSTFLLTSGLGWVTSLWLRAGPRLQVCTFFFCMRCGDHTHTLNRDHNNHNNFWTVCRVQCATLLFSASGAYLRRLDVPVPQDTGTFGGVQVNEEFGGWNKVVWQHSWGEC